ncbi:MAG: PAS domain S-box protein [Ignavibacteriaceae bacterium]|nr:PAS domain S-box protein [Ignavibacteriaceae bacterium]
MENLVPDKPGNNEVLNALNEFRNNLLIFVNYNKTDTSIVQNILTEKGQDFKFGIRLVNRNGVIIGANRSFCSLFAKEEKEIIGESYNSVYDKNNSEDLEELLMLYDRNLLKPNIDYYFERFITTRDKSLFVDGINTFVNTDESSNDNNETLLLTLFRDVTKEKATIGETITSKTDIDPSKIAIISVDFFGKIISWNIGAEKIYGYSATEVAGKSISLLFSRDRKNEFKKIIQQLKDENNIDKYETTNKKKNGSIVQALYQISSIKNSKGILTGITIISYDITEQKRNEIKLRKNEEMYRTLIETSPDAIIMLDLNGKILMSNKQVAVTLGFENVEEIQEQNIFSFFTPRDKKRIFRDARIVIETGILRNLEYTIIRKNGEQIPIEISASLILDMFGKPDGIIGIMRDISERKKAEDALKNSELRFRSIWENSNDGMRLTNSEGNIVAVNKAYCSLIGIAEKDLVGRPYTLIYTQEECGDPIIRIENYRKKFVTRDIDTYRQTNYKYRRQDSVVLIESFSFIDLENGEPLLLGIYHDITEMKKNEEELKNAEKFAAIGKQAAILSHEIKTPLASIKMNIDMLYNKISMSENNQKSFQIVQKEIKRLESLLKNLLLYSRELNLVFHPVDIEKLVDNIQDLMKPVLKKQNITLFNYLTNLRVRGDFRNLQTVFLHLIENSIESMPDGGVIEIYSKSHEDISCSVLIKDNGCGISENTKIFDPFFTTKASGTGLGLTIAKNILKQHNAELTLISSRPGETIFEILFKNNNVE